MINFSVLTLMAMQYLNTPYLWGGNNFNGLDCSGFVQRVLKDSGIIKDNADRTAQGIYQFLVHERIMSSDPESNCVVFFGKSKDRISHIGIAINKYLMIHAGGGGPKIVSTFDAYKHDARVKVQRIDYRDDLVACFKILDL